MKINAIIVNYYTAEYLHPLLQVLENEKELSKIIVVDNGDENDLIEILKDFSKSMLIRNNRNLGFAAAVNNAYQSDFADYYLLINPDTVPENGFVGKMLKTAISSNALIVGPRFFWDEEKVFRLPPAMGYSLSSHYNFYTAMNSSNEAVLLSNNWVFRHERFWEKTSPFNECFLSGACMLIKNDKEFFEQGQIFDERFFLYYEDTDLCLRAISKNRLLIVSPDTWVVHFWDKSPSDKKSIYMRESGNSYLEKYYGKIPDFPKFSIQENSIKFSIVDLGDFSESPKFSVYQKENNELTYIEIGVNSFFVPFSQAIVTGDSFVFPKMFWKKLKQGTYFTRQRTSSNRILSIWKWRKL